jgi:hypothetical protein
VIRGSIHMEMHILDLEERCRRHDEVIKKLTDELIERTAELDDVRTVRDYWFKVYRERLSARRHRYADHVAEFLLTLSRPFRSESESVRS